MKRFLFFAIVAFFSILLSAQDTITREQYNRMVDYTICVAAHKHFETRLADKNLTPGDGELITQAAEILSSHLEWQNVLNQDQFNEQIKKDKYPTAYKILIAPLQQNYKSYVAGIKLGEAINKATSYEQKTGVGDEVISSINDIKNFLGEHIIVKPKSTSDGSIVPDSTSSQQAITTNEDSSMGKIDSIIFGVGAFAFLLMWFAIVYIFIKMKRLDKILKETSSDDNSRDINRLDYLKNSDFSHFFDVCFKKKGVITKEEVRLMVKDLMLDNQKTTPSTEVTEKNEPVIQSSVSDSMSATYYAEPMDESNYFQRVTSDYDPYCHVYKILVSPLGKVEFTLCDNKDMYPSFIANKSEKLTSCEFQGRSLDAKGIELGKNGEVEKEPSGKWKMTKKMTIKFK